MRRIVFCLFVFFIFAFQLNSQEGSKWKELSSDINCLVVSDSGRNGYYDQKQIAELMGTIGEDIWLRCIASTGDIHHFDGVRSTLDPLWMTNFELIYNHPVLMLPWYPALGNHEYRGCPQALIDYSEISARWRMPDRYYTQVVKGKKSTLRLVILDTTPLIDYCRLDEGTYPEAHLQNREKQLEWLESVLSNATEDWIVVLGHHPIYADTPKNPAENAGMQKVLDPILKRHPNVSMYIAGHLHTFQHIVKSDTEMDYVINGSASQSRPSVGEVDGTVFCEATTGISLICADKKELKLYMLNKEGNVIHSISHIK